MSEEAPISLLVRIYAQQSLLLSGKTTMNRRLVLSSRPVEGFRYRELVYPKRASVPGSPSPASSPGGSALFLAIGGLPYEHAARYPGWWARGVISPCPQRTESTSYRLWCSLLLPMLFRLPLIRWTDASIEPIGLLVHNLQLPFFFGGCDLVNVKGEVPFCYMSSVRN